MENKPFRVIEIPHLRNTIKVWDMSKLEGVPKKGSGFTCINGQNENETWIFFEDVENMVKEIENTPIIAHEIIHALQILFERFGMKFENEEEHTAYLMHYIMERILF
jgi:hypothetical protein